MPKRWNIPPHPKSEFGEMYHGEDSLTAFLVIFDAAGALTVYGERYRAKVKLTLPKRDGLTVQSTLVVSMNRAKSLHEARKDLFSLTCQKRVGADGGMNLNLENGTIILKAPHAETIYKPTHLRTAEAAFNLFVPLPASIEERVFIGGQITLRIDEPIPETPELWARK